MAHLPEGTLRRSVDEPFAISDDERAHLAGCPRCRSELDAVRGDHELVLARMTEAGSEGPDTVPDRVTDDDLAVAWTRLDAALAVPVQRTAPPPAVPVPPARRRWSLRRPVVAVGVAVAVVVGTTAAAAATDWLPIFHPAAVKPVSFQFKDLSALPDLAAYGTLTLPRDWQPAPVADAATATARTGIAVPSVGTRPTGVSGAPRYAVLPTATAKFTFSAQKARATAAAHGQTLPPMPAGVDGSTLRLDVGPGVIESWTQQGGVPTLAVVRMTAPTASSEGVSLATLESYLLAQPGIPADLAAQVKALPVNGTVLPVPVPSDVATSTSTTVDGAPATLVKLRDQSGGALVWIRDGRLNAVFGMLSSRDLQAVAHGLG